MNRKVIFFLLILLAVPSLFGQTSASLPTVDQVLAKFVEGAGGKAALQKITSRYVKGILEYVGEGTTQNIEIYKKAPNRYFRLNTTLDGPYKEGFDGSVGWSIYPGETLRVLSGAELSRFKRNSDLYLELKLKEHLPNLTVKGKEKVGNTEAIVLEAVSTTGAPEKLYFDTQSGLLIQNDYEVETPDGKNYVTVLFENYKEVDGIQLPFTIRQVTEDTMIRIAEIKHNLSIDDSKFGKPAN